MLYVSELSPNCHRHALVFYVYFRSLSIYSNIKVVFVSNALKNRPFLELYQLWVLGKYHLNIFCDWLVYGSFFISFIVFHF
jgi:hypothetical protein